MVGITVCRLVQFRFLSVCAPAFCVRLPIVSTFRLILRHCSKAPFKQRYCWWRQSQEIKQTSQWWHSTTSNTSSASKNRTWQCWSRSLSRLIGGPGTLRGESSQTPGGHPVRPLALTRWVKSCRPTLFETSGRLISFRAKTDKPVPFVISSGCCPP